MNRSRGNKCAPACVAGVICLAAAAALTACTGGERRNLLVPDGSPSLVVMDFRKPLALDSLPDGWHHRPFFRTDPMQISFVSKEGRPSIRLATHRSGSMLYRFTDLPLDQYPLLAWDWFIEQPIAGEADESTKAGDDHPARLYLKFRSAEGETHAMEIIWGNRKLRAGDWKYLESFWSRNPFPPRRESRAGSVRQAIHTMVPRHCRTERLGHPALQAPGRCALFRTPSGRHNHRRPPHDVDLPV